MTDFRRYIQDVPDFPSPGILFRDVTPLLASPSAFGDAAKAMAEPFRADPPAKILGIEARGFLFGAALSASGIETMSNVTWPFAADLRRAGKRTVISSVISQGA